MKNLVSRNPVQRFKQGRKIIKAQKGLRFKKVGTSTMGYDIWVDTITGRFYTGDLPGRHDPNKDFGTNEWDRVWTDEGTTMTARGFGKNGIFSKKYTFNGSDYIQKPITTVQSPNQGTRAPYDLSPEAQKIIADRNAKIAAINNKNNSTKPPVKPSTNIYNTPTFRGVKVGGKVKDFSNAITENQKNQLINSGAFTNDDFKDTMSFQNALNRYFGKDGYGSVKSDGMWGNQTQNAFELALKKSQAPVVNTVQGMIVQGNKPTFAPTIEPKTDMTNINIPKQITRSGNFNKSQIRDMIRKEGFNPYDYTGEQRKALKLYLNGQSNDTSLLDGTDLARFTLPFRKKGGQLPSRNPVKRFKSQRKGL